MVGALASHAIRAPTDGAMHQPIYIAGPRSTTISLGSGSEQRAGGGGNAFGGDAEMRIEWLDRGGGAETAHPDERRGGPEPAVPAQAHGRLDPDPGRCAEHCIAV